MSLSLIQCVRTTLQIDKIVQNVRMYSRPMQHRDRTYRIDFCVDPPPNRARFTEERGREDLMYARKG